MTRAQNRLYIRAFCHKWSFCCTWATSMLLTTHFRMPASSLMALDQVKKDAWPHDCWKHLRLQAMKNFKLSRRTTFSRSCCLILAFLCVASVYKEENRQFLVALPSLKVMQICAPSFSLHLRNPNLLHTYPRHIKKPRRRIRHKWKRLLRHHTHLQIPTPQLWSASRQLKQMSWQMYLRRLKPHLISTKSQVSHRRRKYHLLQLRLATTTRRMRQRTKKKKNKEKQNYHLLLKITTTATNNPNFKTTKVPITMRMTFCEKNKYISASMDHILPTSTRNFDVEAPIMRCFELLKELFFPRLLVSAVGLYVAPVGWLAAMLVGCLVAWLLGAVFFSLLTMRKLSFFFVSRCAIFAYSFHNFVAVVVMC
eukprot:m.31134 g.31134  ORF g.31134 m.31134 type:complete len:366 (-) comp10670_c1_seq1:44-1141(-)